MLNKSGCTIGLYFREKQLEVVTYPRQIRLNGSEIDVAALKSDVITEGLRSGINGEVVSQEDGMLMNELIHCPQQPVWLSG